MLTGTVGFFENKQSAFDMEIVGIEETQNSAVLQMFFKQLCVK